MNEPTHDELSVKDYAARFGIHIQTVYTAIRLKRMPFEVIRPAGGDAIRIRVPRESITTAEKRVNTLNDTACG